MNSPIGLARRVFSGSSRLVVANGLSRVIAFLSFPLLSGWLGPAPYGIYSLASTLAGLAAPVGLLGLDLAYTRYYLDVKTSDQAEVESFCWTHAAAASLVSAAVATLFWLGISQHSSLSDRNSIAAFIPGAVVLSVLGVMSTTRLRLQANYGRLAGGVVAAAVVASTVSILLAGVGVRGVLPLLLGSLSSSISCLLWLGFPPLKQLRGFGQSLSAAKRRELFQLGLPCAVTGPIYWLISSSDRWFLGLWYGDSELGIYSVASTLALSGIIFNTAVQQAFFPEASRVFGTANRDAAFQLSRLWEQLALAALFVMLLVGTLGGSLLRLLTTPEFHSGALYIPWLACAAFFYGLAGLGNLSFFLAGKMNRVAGLWCLAAVLCLVLNSILIPMLGGMGAVCVQLLSYFFLSTLTLIFGRFIMPFPLRWRRLGLALLLGLVWLALAAFIALPNLILDMLIKLSITFFLSAGLAWMVSPEVLTKSFLKIKRFCY